LKDSHSYLEWEDLSVRKSLSLRALSISNERRLLENPHAFSGDRDLTATSESDNLVF